MSIGSRVRCALRPAPPAVLPCRQGFRVFCNNNRFSTAAPCREALLAASQQLQSVVDDLQLDLAVAAEVEPLRVGAAPRGFVCVDIG